MGDEKSDIVIESTGEEIEPIFKYKRIANDLQEILKFDSVSCAAVHPKFLIFGSCNGRLYLLDHQGNIVDSYLNTSNLFSHVVGVKDICIDPKGEYVATCSVDGKVVITGLFSKENNQKIDIGKPVKTVALDSDPKVPAGKRFIVGDEKLTMYEKSFIKNLKSSKLCDAEGHVFSISWNGQFVAWASYSGVRIYDLNTMSSLGLIKWEEPKNAKLENFRCNFYWSDASTLLIGWVDTIRVCVLNKRKALGIFAFILEQVSSFQTSFYICGLAPFTTNQLVVLGYSKEKDINGKALRPVLCVINYELNNSEEVSTDSLSLNGYEDYKVNDYILGCIIEENRYFVISPNDLVIASVYDTDDHVQWLIKQKEFEKAMNVVSTNNGKYSLVEVTRLYIDHLLCLKQFDEAAKLCFQVLGHNKEVLEEVINKFVGELRTISAYLPTEEHNKLKPQIYEMVLYEYLKFDTHSFLNLLRKWPKYLYDSSAIINAIYENISESNHFHEALAILYSHQKKYASALNMYLRLEREDVFDTILLLIEEQQIPSEIVVQQLEQNEEYLYKYLDYLEKLDKSGKYHLKLVKLYAKFDREKLLPLLKRSNSCPMQEALDICKREMFYPELVYLLGRIGNTSEALYIIIRQIKDMKMAIDFCKEHDDSDLWNNLIDESLDSPEMMRMILDAVIGFVNPEILVSKIKLGQKIPGLRKSLIKILCDYRLQIKVQEGCKEIVFNKIFELHEMIVNKQHKSKYISYENSCDYCKQNILMKTISKHDLIVFGCGHVFHETCLIGKVKGCIICNAVVE